MAGEDGLLRRQSTRTKFRNGDMDFAFTWALGVSQIVGPGPGEVLAAVATVKDGDPRSWRRSFGRQSEALSERGRRFEAQGHRRAAAHPAFGAAYARRFALHYEDPTTSAWRSGVSSMEQEFERAIDLAGVPLRAVEVPFEHGTLPGYYLEVDGFPRPTLLVIGGGDTFREDLFYFGGYPAWRRGYHALMVDLPGQGNTPAAGFTFRHEASGSIGACLDWLAGHATSPDPRIATYGLSGGGYFTAQAVAADPRIQAWIASTPITDMARLFERELGSAVRAPGWLLNTIATLLGRTDAILDVSLKKYAWQFGTPDFAEAVARVRSEAPVVDDAAITCPSLFLLGEGEAAELRRQTEDLAASMARDGRRVTVRAFRREDGDAHCQVTNLALAHLVVFDWLDRIFDRDPERSDPPPAFGRLRDGEPVP